MVSAAHLGNRSLSRLGSALLVWPVHSGSVLLRLLYKRPWLYLPSWRRRLAARLSSRCPLRMCGRYRSASGCYGRLWTLNLGWGFCPTRHHLSRPTHATTRQQPTNFHDTVNKYVLGKCNRHALSLYFDNLASASHLIVPPSSLPPLSA